MPVVQSLLIKPSVGRSMIPVKKVVIDKEGRIEGNILCAPLRQVLLTHDLSLKELNLQPGDLRENIVLDDSCLYEYSSGTVIKIGNVLIRLTFLCEPCSKIKDKVNLRTVRDRRGFLGQFISAGVIELGQDITVSPHKFEPVPYHPVERLKWYLSKCEQPVYATDLVWQAGLAPSYCRALPAILRKNRDIDSSRVLFKTSQKPGARNWADRAG